jgi:hypothetical protein
MGVFPAAGLFCAHTVQAQGDYCQTVGNIIKSVAVEWTGTAYGTRITWEKSSLPVATGYIIYEYKGGSECVQEIHRIGNVDITTYLANYMSDKGFTIAVSTAVDPLPITRQHLQPVIKSIDFDPCTYYVEIHWKPYIGWGDTDTEYAVQVDVGNTGVYTAVTEHLSDSSYIWRNAPVRVPLTIRIQAVNKNDNTAISYSKPEERVFDFPRPPGHIFLSELQDGEGNYALSFEIDATTELTNFEVQRAAEDGNLTTVHSFSDKYLSNYMDPAGQGLFRYRIVAKNECGNVVCASNELVNIRLHLLQSIDSWQLQWKSADPALIEVYDLDRRQPNPANLLSNSTAIAYTDLIAAMSSEASLRFCYTISGKYKLPVTDLLWMDVVTTSGNCAYYNPMLIMPDAVDPLSTIVNPQTGRARNRFGPVINANPQTYSYRLTILNRNVAVVADIVKNKGDDPIDKSWDGYLKNGGIGPEEVYTYHLSVEFEGGRQQTVTGTVAVVYSK